MNTNIYRMSKNRNVCIVVIEFEGGEWYSSNNSESNVYIKKYKLLNFGNESLVSELGINSNYQMRYTSFLTFSSLKDTFLHAILTVTPNVASPESDSIMIFNKLWKQAVKFLVIQAKLKVLLVSIEFHSASKLSYQENS